MEALRLYDDLERVGIEREAEERSRKETRMDRNVRLLFSYPDLELTRASSTFDTKTLTILTWNQAKHSTPVHHLAARHPHPLPCHPRLHLSLPEPLQHNKHIHIRTLCPPSPHPSPHLPRNTIKHRPSPRKVRSSLSLLRRTLRMDRAPLSTAMPQHREHRRRSVHH